MINALTIDVEDYFQVHAFSKVIRYEDWGNYECRIEQNIDRILKILNLVHSPKSIVNSGIRATFFVLGWIAERYPDLIRRIKDEGHEIACHGYVHKLIYTQLKEEFREDIRRAKTLLEDIVGSEVIGYRAPSYSITHNSQWALEVLTEEGFKYDSSIFPIHHDFYGFPSAPRFPFKISLNGTDNFEFSMLNFESEENKNSKFITHNSKLEMNNSLTHSPINQISENSIFNTHNSKFIIEFPLSTVQLLGMNLPISGGGYFRLFPYLIIKKGLRSINEVEKQPFIFYIHPWEVDPDQPRIDNLPLKSSFRHYINLQKTEIKLKKLLKEFNFAPIKEILELNNLLLPGAHYSLHQPQRVIARSF